MTPSELRESLNADSHFFDRKTMRFFGDRMSNYGVRAVTVRANGIDIPAWELYRKRPVKAGNTASAYFHRDTFARIFADLE